VVSILSQQGNSIVEQIRQNLSSTGTNATGKTSRSLRFEVVTEGFKTTLRIIGKAYFFVVETGRKATPQYTEPSYEFVKSIEEWMRARGKEGSGYGLAKYIHQHGTKLYRDGGRQDIVSNVVNTTLVDTISKSILETFSNEYLKNVVKITGSGTTINI